MTDYKLFNQNLKAIVKLLYDDLSYEIINYLIRNNHKTIIDEQEITADLNLSYTQIRQSIIILQSHRIVLTQEHKNKKEEKEKEKDIKYMKKNKTSDVYLNPDYISIIQNRFDMLKNKLTKKIQDYKTRKFICPECNEIFTLSDYAHFNQRCKKCFSKPYLTEIPAQNKEELKKTAFHIITILNEIVQASASEYTSLKKEQIENTGFLNKKRAANEIDKIMNKGNFDDPLKRISFERLQDEKVDLFLNNIKNNEEKWKSFKDLVLYYTNGQLSDNKVIN